METKERLIFVSPEELKPGVNFLDEGKIIVYKDATGKMMATKNRCKHQGGSFHKTNDCTLTCSRHGWQLDPSTMTYLVPTGGKINQEQLIAEVTSDGKIQIFEPYATGRDDSGILIEYKGHRILNNVDCSNLCNGILPLVDVLLSSFAGGASGYPVCWAKLYSEDQINRIVTKNRWSLLQQLINIVAITKPRIFIPFAGYFIEAHPADLEIKLLNVKNTSNEACELIKKYYSDIITLVPEPGGILDVGLCEINSSKQQQMIKTDYDFEKYLVDIKCNRFFPPLQDHDGIKKYFGWAGFSGDLVLHVIETDELFTNVVREYYVDFRDLAVVDQPPDPPYRYLQMKVRSDVFRSVLQYGLPWE